jgi:NADH-quinone oxidoreductase subunit J
MIEGGMSVRTSPRARVHGVRGVALLALLAMLGTALWSIGTAVAQPAAPQVRVQAPERPSPGDTVEEPAITPGKRLDHSKAAAPLFWLFALMVVGGALFVVTRRNLIAAVMGMVGTFFAIAAVYVMLYAHFLAAIQVLVYAGAIMVLFVFVIMILNRPEDHPMSREARGGQVVAVLAALYLLVRLSGVLWDVKPPRADAGALPAPVTLASAYKKGSEEVPPKIAQWGSPRAIGKTLFTDYLFPFEAVSLVLLIAVVGAIAVARPDEKREASPHGDEEQSA